MTAVAVEKESRDKKEPDEFSAFYTLTIGRLEESTSAFHDKSALPHDQRLPNPWIRIFECSESFSSKMLAGTKEEERYLLSFMLDVDYLSLRYNEEPHILIGN